MPRRIAAPPDDPVPGGAALPGLRTLPRADTLSQQAYDALRRLIRQGGIARGEMLSEATLAASLGVSRTPVREALLKLFQDGIVEILPKRGFRLAELDRAAIAEIRIMRTALEDLVVRRLCEAPAEGLSTLRALAEEAACGGAAGAAAIFEHDEVFHSTLADLAGLGQVKRVLSGLRAKMHLIASGARVPVERSLGALREHVLILARIEARDADGAAALMREHVARSIAAFEQAAGLHEDATLTARPS